MPHPENGRGMNSVCLLAGLLILAWPAWGSEKTGSLSVPGRVIQTANGEIAIMRGNSPRMSGLSYQYQGMKTPLRGNLILSDVLLPSDPWHLWDGQTVPRFDIGKQTPENYHESHNHYQSLLSEVINATSGANGIPIWGESVAAVNGANVWGGFFSARSSCFKRDLIGGYLPRNLERGCGPDFDAQLTGLEVDVLNAGKPGVYPNKAKHGVQIVGFGNPNGQALSVISENFDRGPADRRGQFESILYAQNSLQPGYGRFIVMDFDKARIGLDMRKPLFSEGAMDFRSEGAGTGIMLESGRSGEIYGGSRWPGIADKQGWLSMRLGNGGYRLVSNDNTREIMAIDNHGGIYLNGDVYLNGERLGAGKFDNGEIHLSMKKIGLTILAMGLLLLVINVFVVRYFVRLALLPERRTKPI
jgi:hypothetical protein